MREEYEAWFIGKFGFPPMPIHSRVLDFCWEGYQAGYEQGKKDGWEACETCHGIVDGKHMEAESLRQQLQYIASCMAAEKSNGRSHQHEIERIMKCLKST